MFMFFILFDFEGKSIFVISYRVFNPLVTLITPAISYSQGINLSPDIAVGFNALLYFFRFLNFIQLLL